MNNHPLLRCWQPMTLAETFLWGPDRGPDQCSCCGARLCTLDDDSGLCTHCASLTARQRVEHVVEELDEASLISDAQPATWGGDLVLVRGGVGRQVAALAGAR